MNHTIRVAFCGVLAGLGLALMFLTALLPMATFALPALAGLLMIMIVIEMGARWAWPTFAVVAILSVFFVPDKQAALLYVIFFGYYPILKALIERLKNKIVQWVLKYAVFNAAIVSAYFIAIYLLSIPADSLSLFGVSLPWVFWIAGGIPKKVAIIDERGELAGTYCGIPQNDLGLCSDILDHYPKGEGMIQAVRALSPQFIFCDELGGQEDLEAVQQGLHAGAAIISTIHAGNIDDLLRKKQGQSLLQSQAFGYVAMMDAVVLGQIAEIHKAGDLLGQIGRQYCSGVHDNAVRLHGVV